MKSSYASLSEVSGSPGSKFRISESVVSRVVEYYEENKSKEVITAIPKRERGGRAGNGNKSRRSSQSKSLEEIIEGSKQVVVSCRLRALNTHEIKNNEYINIYIYIYNVDKIVLIMI